MCRIAGIVNYSENPAKNAITLMRDAMQHGGPDDAGIYMDETWPLAFGHRRLSLIDLSMQGHQPMLDPSGEIVLSFNGEIYNFQVLKAELINLGYSFRSTSDTEVIIYAYLAWGTSCFSRFNGMFALSLLDKRTGKLILARDHMGIKPLYYSIEKDAVYFASEIRAFTALKPHWPENPEWKKYFLLFGHLPEPVTTLANVQPLAKGSYLEMDLHTRAVTTHRFFYIYYNYPIVNKEEAVAAIREKLEAAVQRHLISDAPIGVFLSGGLDSSILTLLAKPFVGDNLHTLSIDFASEQYSERYYQELVVQKAKSIHRSFLVTKEDFIAAVPDIIKAMDQPSNDGINSYFICKYAKEYGLKAVLSGLGADELFGGYHSFTRAASLHKTNWLPSFMFALAGLSGNDKFRRISFLQRRDGMGEYLFNRGFFIPAQIAQLLDCTEAEVREIVDTISFPPLINKLNIRERVSFYETNFYLQNQLLKDTDYMSMWNSMEVRVPFLDRELIELVYNIHPETRYIKPGKHLLVKACEDVLPEAIYKRSKQSFIFPFEKWMQDFHPKKTSSAKLTGLYKGLCRGKVHWSRYWCYALAEMYRLPSP